MEDQDDSDDQNDQNDSDDSHGLEAEAPAAGTADANAHPVQAGNPSTTITMTKAAAVEVGEAVPDYGCTHYDYDEKDQAGALMNENESGWKC